LTIWQLWGEADQDWFLLIYISLELEDDGDRGILDKTKQELHTALIGIDDST
jgi:hypothetical protein